MPSNASSPSAARPPEDEAPPDVVLVRRLLAAQFPRWAHLPLVPFPSAGTDNAVFRLGDDMAVRLPRAWDVAIKVGKEQQWLPRLAAALPLEIPLPVGWGTPTEFYRWPWSVFRWLDGEDASVARIDDPHQAARDLGRFVAALQRVDAPDGPLPGDHNDWRGAPLARHDGVVRELIAALEGSVDGAAASAVWDAALAAPPHPGRPAWFHGDLLATNLLVREGRLTAVIDFGCSGTGDPAYDAMAAWTFCSAETRPVFRAAARLDDATWERGRGVALFWALLAFRYLQGTHPLLAAIARRTLDVLTAHQLAP